MARSGRLPSGWASLLAESSRVRRGREAGRQLSEGRVTGGGTKMNVSACAQALQGGVVSLLSLFFF